MDTMTIQSYNNQPKSVRFDETHIWVTVQDGRIIGTPLSWFPWLVDASDAERSDYELSGFSIWWDSLDEGIDMAMLAGNYAASKNLVTPEQVAEMYDIAPNTVYRLLRREADLAEDEKRLPGAFKESGDKHRAKWWIPRESAQNFEPSKRGRKAQSES